MLTTPSIQPILYPEQPFLAQVRACILNNLDDEYFGVAELAGAVFLSRAQLFRKLRALSGRNPARYIHLVRIEQARALLANTNFTVSEIAWRTGFSDPSYLRRVFLRETGERLGEYRRRCRESRGERETGREGDGERGGRGDDTVNGDKPHPPAPLLCSNKRTNTQPS